MSRLQESLSKIRENILTIAGNKYYSEIGEFFDTRKSFSDIDLKNLGFDEDTIDSITIKKIVEKEKEKRESTNIYTVEDYDESQFKPYKMLKRYIELKKRIVDLNLPEDVKSITDRSEYQKAVLYYFIKSRWKYVNDELKKGQSPQSIPIDKLIKMLIQPLSEDTRQTICGQIPRNVLEEIELRYASELKQSGSFNGGSTRKRKSSSTHRRRPSRKSSSTKRRRSRRPHRRTSRK
jgi:hypothetical protein